MSPRDLRLLIALRHADAANVAEVFPADRRAAMRAAILAGESTATPALAIPRLRRRGGARRRSLRAKLAAPALAAALAAVTLAVVSSTPSHPPSHPSHPVIHASPVSFRYPTRGPDDGYIIATVLDPLAAQSSLDAAFRAAGLDIAVSIVPASPSAVGTVVEISEPSSGPQIETLTGGSCVTGGGGPGNCPIGLKIPRAFRGSGSITLGRPANPGEPYDSTNSAFAPGESLHCSGLIGKTLAAAAPVLAARGITAQRRSQGATALPQPAPTPVATTTTAASPTATSTSTTSTSTSSSGSGTQGAGTAPPGAYVVDGSPIKLGVVMLQTQAEPLSPSQLAQDTHMYDAGC
jgi:hypothetical protein